MRETANTGRIAAAIARRRVPLGFAFGALAILLARPTVRSLMIGGAVALVGEACRIWAAGHLEKGLEVTRSGPYRFTSHPLYVGSALIATGVAIASARLIVATVVFCYFAATTVAAIRHVMDSASDLDARLARHTEMRAAEAETRPPAQRWGLAPLLRLRRSARAQRWGLAPVLRTGRTCVLHGRAARNAQGKDDPQTHR